MSKKVLVVLMSCIGITLFYCHVLLPILFVTYIYGNVFICLRLVVILFPFHSNFRAYIIKTLASECANSIVGDDYENAEYTAFVEPLSSDS